MRRHILLVAVVLIVGATLWADPEPSRKQAWAWTLEERIAARTNAEAARDRVNSAGRGRIAATSSSGPMVDSFDGKTHPELFLPHEVFRTLIAHAFLGTSRAGDIFRNGLMAEITGHGLPPDFWQRLRSISSVYVADSHAEIDIGAGVREQTGPARSRAREALALKQLDVCRSRAAALDAARKEFGPERFDRFLYEVIAVNMFRMEDRLPAPELLRRHAGGCR